MAHVATITIDHTKVPGDLTDYVGLIVPDGSAGYSALYALCLEGGGDIRLFKSDDTTELAREIVSFSVSAETGEIHYKYSGTLSSSVDTDIHVYADGSSSDYGVTDTYGRNAVWNDYEAVYHLNDTGSTAVDSTGNHDGTYRGTMPNSVTGKLGDGQETGGSGDEMDAGNAWNFSSNAAFTYTCWLNPNTVGAPFPGQYVVGDSSGRRSLNYLDNGKVSILGWNGTTQQVAGSTSLSTGTWHYVGITNDGSTGTVYIDGSSDGSGSFAYTEKSSSTVDGINVRANQTDLKIDEVRVSTSEQSSNLFLAEYNNQNFPSTFYSVAAVSGVIEQALTATAQASGLIVKQVQRDIEVTAQATASFTRSIGRTLQATAQAVASVGKTLGKGLAVTAGATVTLLKTQVNLIVLSVTAQANASLTKLAINTVTLAVTASATVSVHILKTLTRILTATAQGTVSLVQSGLIISRELLVVARANVSITLAQTLSKALTATASAVVSLAKDFGFLDKYPENEATYEDKYPEQ